MTYKRKEQIGDATIHVGDCIETMRTLPEKSVQTCVTSPPYFGLRDYGNDGQIGLEATPDQFVAALVAVFREVRRVLRDDGTVWLNLGDSYASGTKGSGGGWAADPKNYSHKAQANGARKYDTGGLADKQLMGIPWRVAFALQQDGWYLRQDIIWHKPNPMPESVRDRCTKAHEYIFLLTKSARYFYDAEAVKEGADPQYEGRYKHDFYTGQKESSGQGRPGEAPNTAGPKEWTGKRNKRSVWTVTTKPYSGAHFATFPPRLIEPCILAGTPERGCCPHCGAPWERVVERGSVTGRKDSGGVVGMADEGMYKGRAGESSFRTTGHQPTCTCPDHEPVPSVVLDPFGGSGTTAGVALLHQRKAIICELNPEYAALISDRIRDVHSHLDQGGLFA